MTFEKENLENFFTLFETVRDQIASFPGCTNLKIYSAIHDPFVVFTHSEWLSESYLEEYRKSELFKSTWMQTKKLFSQRAEAWSLKDHDN